VLVVAVVVGEFSGDGGGWRGGVMENNESIKIYIAW
jgi:hypothetical protein